MTLNPVFVIKLIIGIVVFGAGIVVLLNMPPVHNTPWVATGIIGILGGVGIAIP